MSKVVAIRCSEELAEKLQSLQNGRKGDAFAQLIITALEHEQERNSDKPLFEQMFEHLRVLTELVMSQSEELEHEKEKNANQTKMINDYQDQNTANKKRIDELRLSKVELEQTKQELEDTKNMLNGYQTLNADQQSKIKHYEDLFKLMKLEQPGQTEQSKEEKVKSTRARAKKTN